jgi:hypothetical protein
LRVLAWGRYFRRKRKGRHSEKKKKSGVWGGEEEKVSELWRKKGISNRDGKMFF